MRLQLHRVSSRIPSSSPFKLKKPAISTASPHQQTGCRCHFSFFLSSFSFRRACILFSSRADLQAQSCTTMPPAAAPTAAAIRLHAS